MCPFSEVTRPWDGYSGDGESVGLRSCAVDSGHGCGTRAFPFLLSPGVLVLAQALEGRITNASS